MVGLLLERGAAAGDSLERSAFPWALKEAAQNGHVAVIDLVLRRGEALCDVSEAATWAVRGAVRATSGRAAVLAALVQHAADALVADPHGRDNVRDLLDAGEVGVAEALLAAGADPSVAAYAEQQRKAWRREARAEVEQECAAHVLAARQLLLAATLEARRADRTKLAADRVCLTVVVPFIVAAVLRPLMQ
jgi:hypothetical protein